MSLTKFIRDLQKKYEAIPTPGAVVYNATVSKVLRKSEAKIAKDVVEKVRNGIILDLGSGTGYLSIEIAKQAPNLRAYGVDLSRQMVKIARRHAKGVSNAQFELGNVANLLFEDDSVDFIVSTGSLHHWQRPVNVFDECYRVLKPGKEAWIYDGCPETFKTSNDKRKMSKRHGFIVGHLGHRVSTLHGFSLEEYQTVIKDTLEQTAFRYNYQMALTDIWMKITLQKHK